MERVQQTIALHGGGAGAARLVEIGLQVFDPEDGRARNRVVLRNVTRPLVSHDLAAGIATQHQFEQLAHIETRTLGDHRSLGIGDDVRRADQLIAGLGDLARTGRSEVHRIAGRRKVGHRLGNQFVGATHHDRQCSGLRTHLAAGHRSINDSNPSVRCPADLVVELANGVGRHRRTDDEQDVVFTRPRQQAIGPLQHRPHLWDVGDHEEDEISPLPQFAGIVCPDRPIGQEL